MRLPVPGSFYNVIARDPNNVLFGDKTPARKSPVKKTKKVIKETIKRKDNKNEQLILEI